MIEPQNGLNPKAIAIKDPLKLDSFFVQLPFYNYLGDVGFLIEKVSEVSGKILDDPSWNPNKAAAALRDLGMICSSVKRHGLEPICTSPDVSPALLKLAIFSGTVPRDTVFSYGPWNPIGDRQRTFTPLVEEKEFISAFTQGMSNLDGSLKSLGAIQTEERVSSSTPELLRNAQSDFEGMVTAIIAVHKLVPPQIFTGELRPYFDPLLVGDKYYLGPGGAQMPVLLVDYFMWGLECKDPKYQRYLEENLEYTPPYYRQLVTESSGRKSVVKILLEETSSDGNRADSLKAGVGVFNRLIAFRAPHLQIAKQNFQLRTQTDVGSGGYDPDILEYLIDQSRNQRQTLMTALQTYE